jgi:aminoglycoside phosphotransferase (APT) family kinase protein
MTEPASNADTRAVRSSEELDWKRLAAYLREWPPQRLGKGIDASAAMQVEQFPGGHSNLTYLLRFGGSEIVLRRPPFGPVPPRAHDMAREYRILAAVNPLFPLAPEPYLLCEDTSVIGSAFYVMERRRGFVVRDEEPPEVRDPAMRGRISSAIVDSLADLHSIDLTAHRLASLGKPAGFVARQVRGWMERWHGSKTSDVPEMESLAVWMAGRIPSDPDRPSLVHGDYKLDNVMLDHGAPDRLVAILDWEMSAVGDPLVDLGILLCYWFHVAGESQGTALAGVTARPGWFDRQQILDRYAARSSRNIDGIAFYEVFAVFKLAVVVQQIYARYVRAQTDDPRFAGFGERVVLLARMAGELAGRERP